MAGKPRRRLEYAGWNTDIFDNDTKIDKLLDAQGWIGFCIYFFLCQKAFSSDGYFYRWCFDDSATTARKMGCGIGAGAVEETVNYCLRIGLFDKRLFDRWNVITSKGIQRSYWAVAKNRRDKTVYQELWLLEKSESDGVVFVRLKTEMSGANDHLSATNSHLSATNETVVKESKVKGNNNIMCKTDVLALFESLWELYPSKKGKGRISDKSKSKIADIGFDEMKRAIDRYIKEWEKDKDWRKPQNGSTFFNSGYIDYLDSNYEESKPVSKSTNKFNQFEQREYDFDELEKELTSN